MCFVCVYFLPIHSGRLACGRTSRGHTGGRSHRISHPRSFCGACLLFFSQEGFSHSFPSSTVKSNFVFYRFSSRPINRDVLSQNLDENNSVCFVCFLPIHSGHQVRWTYQPGSHRIFHLPSFCGACLNFSREKDSAIPFPRRP